MKNIFPTLLVAFALVGGPGCSEDPAIAPVRHAFDDFMNGLNTANTQALWDLADDETHRAFDDLAIQMLEVAGLVRKHYPTDELDEGLKAVGAHMLTGRQSGRALFSAFIDPRKLQIPVDEGSREIEHVDFQGDIAIVSTKAGTSLEFIRDKSGAYRTAIFLYNFLDLPPVQTLKENIAIAKKNCTVLGGR